MESLQRSRVAVSCPRLCADGGDSARQRAQAREPSRLRLAPSRLGRACALSAAAPLGPYPLLACALTSSSCAHQLNCGKFKDRGEGGWCAATSYGALPATRSWLESEAELARKVCP